MKTFRDFAWPIVQDDELTGRIIGAAIEVHRGLGPGMFEKTYHLALAHELGLRGILVASEVPISLQYADLCIDGDYRIDILVDDEVIVEVKALDAVLPVHKAQLITYLKLAGKDRGLLLNFNEVLLKDGVHRLFSQRKSS